MNKKDIIKLYESFSQKVEMISFGTFRQRYFPLDRSSIERLRLTGKYLKRKDARILDAGCGPGWTSIYLIEEGFTNVHSMDIDNAALKEIKSFNRLYKKIKIITSNVENPKVKRKYDQIILFEVLEHLPNLEAAIKNLRKILRKEGELIITIPNGFGSYALYHDYFIDRFIRKFFIKKDFSIRSHHVNLHNHKWWCNFFLRNDFEIKVSENVEFMAPVLKNIGFSSQHKLIEKDIKISKKISPSICSDWFFILKKK